MKYSVTKPAAAVEQCQVKSRKLSFINYTLHTKGTYISTCAELPLTALKLRYNCNKITLNSLEVSSFKGIHKTGLCEKVPA